MIDGIEIAVSLLLSVYSDLDDVRAERFNHVFRLV